MKGEMTMRALRLYGPGDIRLVEVPVPDIGEDEILLRTKAASVCGTDIRMWQNGYRGVDEQRPLTLGHEFAGIIERVGAKVPFYQPGMHIALQPNIGCGICDRCVAGNQHLCREVQATIGGRHGAFAEKVRAHWVWVSPLPEGLDAAESGPLLCGGITVFAPLRELGISPTARVGVIGIGGLGHMALKFCRAWGCEVTAFTTSASKEEEARAFGAHRVVTTGDAAALKKLAGSFDLIIDTVNASLDWPGLLTALAPKGRLHVVGVPLEPIAVPAFGLISGQKALSGSPTGSRGAIDSMLGFAARHGVAPQTEHFPMSRVNEALDHLRAGKARYRIVLDADF